MPIGLKLAHKLKHSLSNGSWFGAGSAHGVRCFKLFSINHELAFMRSRVPEYFTAALVIAVLVVIDIVFVQVAYNETQQLQETYCGIGAVGVLLLLAAYNRWFVVTVVRDPRERTSFRPSPFCRGLYVYHTLVTMFVIAAGVLWLLSCRQPRTLYGGLAGPLLIFWTLETFCNLLWSQVVIIDLALAAAAIVSDALPLGAGSSVLANKPNYPSGPGPPEHRWVYDAVVIIMVVVSISIYEVLKERTARRNFAVTRSLANKISEEKELKRELYAVTMEKHGLVNVLQEAMEAPVEAALTILSQFILIEGCPHEVVMSSQKIMNMLGSGRDIYRPTLETEFDRREADPETRKLVKAMLPETQNGMYFAQPSNSCPFPEDTDELRISIRDVGSSLNVQRHNRHSSVNVSLLPEENKYLSVSMKALDNWEFDLLFWEEHTNNRALYFVGIALFHKFELIKKFKISSVKLKSFLSQLQTGYLDNPYHNSTHGADVGRSVAYFLRKGRIAEYCTDIEILASIFSGIIHDYGHKGLNNIFTVAIRDPIAVSYNDMAVLENYHLAESFKILFKPENFFLCDMPRSDFAQFRKLVVDLVLATDMANHTTYIAKFRSCLMPAAVNQEATSLRNITEALLKSSQSEKRHTQGPGPTASGALERMCHTAEHRLLLLKLTIKAADLGHSGKPLQQHLVWTGKINDEFMKQGDMAAELGLNVEPHMVRHTANVQKKLAFCQVGFFNYVVNPLFHVYINCLQSSEYADDDLPVANILQSNLEYWESLSRMPDEVSTDSQKQDSTHAPSLGSDGQNSGSYKQPKSTMSFLQGSWKKKKTAHEAWECQRIDISYRHYYGRGD